VQGQSLPPPDPHPFRVGRPVSICLADADDHLELFDCHPQFFERPLFIAKVIRPDDQFDHCARRVAQVGAVGIFVIPRKVRNDGFAIDQEFECRPVDGKVLVWGHDASSAAQWIDNFEANRALPCTRENKMIK
jgi:hypothetical protein